MIPLMNTIPSRHLAVMTYTIIAINCVVFLFQLGLNPRELEQFVYAFAVVPARYLASVPLGGEADGASDAHQPPRAYASAIRNLVSRSHRA